MGECPWEQKPRWACGPSNNEAMPGDAPASLTAGVEVLQTPTGVAQHFSCVDVGNFLACTFSEMTFGKYKATTAVPMYEVIPVTDARSLWDAIHRLSTTFQEKRVEIDVAALRQSCRSLRWVPTEQQRADALTKRSASLRDAFRRWAQQPIIVLTDAKSAEHGADNAAWKHPMSTKEKVYQCHCVKTYDHHNMLA